VVSDATSFLFSSVLNLVTDSPRFVGWDFQTGIKLLTITGTTYPHFNPSLLEQEFSERVIVDDKGISLSTCLSSTVLPFGNCMVTGSPTFLTMMGLLS
jgi:hypothetical protein